MFVEHLFFLVFRDLNFIHGFLFGNLDFVLAVVITFYNWLAMSKALGQKKSFPDNELFRERGSPENRIYLTGVRWHGNRFLSYKCLSIVWMEIKRILFNPISYNNFRILKECILMCDRNVLLRDKGYFPFGNIIPCFWHNYNLRLKRDHFSESCILCMPFWNQKWCGFVGAVSPCIPGISRYLSPHSFSDTYSLYSVRTDR